MTELAVTDGMPPPADLPQGEFWATRLEDGSIRVDRADARILISAAFLTTIALDTLPGIALEWAPVPGEPFWSAALLKISGVNRTVIYRITDYMPRVNGYIAEWPD